MTLCLLSIVNYRHAFADEFTKCDTDCSGKLSCDELSHLCHGQGFTDEDIQSIICKCDTDEDGNISKEEFMAAMYTNVPLYVVTFIKHSPVLKGHIFLVLSYKLNLFSGVTCLIRSLFHRKFHMNLTSFQGSPVL
jgi:hypothetical protein